MEFNTAALSSGSISKWDASNQDNYTCKLTQWAEYCKQCSAVKGRSSAMPVNLILKETHTQTEMAATGQHSKRVLGMWWVREPSWRLWFADVSGEDMFQFFRIKCHLWTNTWEKSFLSTQDHFHLALPYTDTCSLQVTSTVSPLAEDCSSLASVCSHSYLYLVWRNLPTQ